MTTELERTQTTGLSITSPTPQPGEIWQIRDGAIVMIVREPAVTDTDVPDAVSVMLLSRDIQFTSDIDVQIPQSLSGFNQDVIAQTWQVFEMSRWDLSQPTGVRLARAIYDGVLDIGDYFHGLISQPDNTQSLGLILGDRGSHKHPEIQAFHTQQTEIARSLTLALQQSQHEFQAVRATERLIAEATQQTAEFQELEQPIEQLKTGLVQLKEWFNAEIDQAIAGWEHITNSFSTPQLSVAMRSGANTADTTVIEQWIEQLTRSNSDIHIRQAVINLGDRLPAEHPLKSQVIEALIQLLQTTTDNETLWAAVESLWKIDPGNPAAGVKRVKLVDLGMQVAGEAVALAVAIVPQAEQMAVLLQVYPSQTNAYLPEGLQLSLLDESGNALRQLAARQSDIYIQLKFTGQPGEQFGVQVALGEANLTEDFMM